MIHVSNRGCAPSGRPTSFANEFLDELLKKNISDPFDFQHVTHTNSSQFQSLDTANKDRLVSEFSAIRASQRPDTELKGIPAQSLLFRNFSSDDLRNRDPSDMKMGPRSLPSNSPPESPDPRCCATAPVDSGAEWKRESRCFENFSRPVSRLQKAPGSPSIVPPPRMSSRLACSDIPEPTCQTIDALLGLHTPSTFPEFVHSTAEDRREDDLPLSQLDLTEVFQPEVGHAFTTTDSTAKVIKSPLMTNYPSDLADVPEDSETTFPIGNVHRKSRASPPEFTLQPTSAPAFHRLSPKTRQSIGNIDQSSQPVGSPTIPGYRFGFDQPMRVVEEDHGIPRPDEIGTAIDESWEDDIDFCYEHAAESNSNFDWHRTSLDDPGLDASNPSDAATAPVLDLPGPNNRESINKSRLASYQPSPSTLETPDLEPTSALTVSTPHDALTPMSAVEASDRFGHGNYSQKNEFLKAESQAFIASGLGNEMTQEAIYEEMISGNDDNRHHLAFYPLSEDQVLESTSSPRSGGSPISKCNSQESMILSRAGSIARKHRSSVSTTSIPELVHSMNSSCEIMEHDTVNDEQSTFTAFDVSPRSSRHNSSTHQQIKSVAREATQLPSNKNKPSDGHAEGEAAVPAITLTHDRAKSASAFEAHVSAVALKAAGPPPTTRARASTLTRTNPPNRKARTSYSLFPASPATSR